MMKTKRLYIFLIAALTFCQLAFAQDSGVMIRGKLVSDFNEELIGATVLEIDATGRVISNATTNMNGEFSMRIKNPNNKLRAQYFGFQNREVAIGNNRDFRIVLKEDNILDEVVVTQKRTVSKSGLDIPAREVAFSSQKLSTDVFEGQQIASIDDALQGQISGLDIIGTGNVGQATQMRLRGISSLNSNSAPLIVIDGIQRPDIVTSNFDFSGATEQQFSDLLMINPEDIESITVLKDAGGTAIYGSRGSSGVLEITTKRGTHGATRLTYTYKFLGAQQPEGIKMLNGDQYTMLMKQAYFNPNQDPAASNIKEFAYDPTWSEYRYYNNNTDWRKEVTQIGLTHDHYITLSGGGERAQFRITGGYMTKSGTVIGQNWDRFTTRMNLDYRISDRIKVTTEMAFTYSDNDYNWSDGRADNGYVNGKDILWLAYRKMPNMSVYDKDENGRNLPSYYNMLESSQLYKGKQGAIRNPVALARLATNNQKTYDVLPVIRLTYDLVDRGNGERMLRYEGYVQFDINNSKTHKFLPKEVSPLIWNSEDINRLEDSDSERFGTQIENKILFKPYLGEDHVMQGLVSFYTSDGRSSWQDILEYGYPNGITSPQASSVIKKTATGLEQYRTMAMTAFLSYSYKSKYILMATMRRDGSTRFGKNNKWGNFPGLSLRWNISDEAFMDSTNEWLTMFSLRPSWGITGTPPNREYMHFSVYKPWSNYNGTSTFRPDNIRLTNLKWETKTEYNLGTDVELWDGKYTLTGDVYYSKTKDLLFPNAPLPGSTGFGSLLYRNVGSLRNIGWELNVTGNRFVKIRDFSLDAYLNITNTVNTLVSLDQDILDDYNKAFNYTERNANYKQHMETGHAYGSIYGFRYKGVYQYSIDNPVVVGANYDPQKGSCPVARDADGNVILDSKGKPLPMYYYYGPQGINYEFVGGDAIYEDINHDGMIDEEDIVYLGNSNPKLSGGFGLIFRWKSLSCNAYFVFRYGNKIINQSRREAENMLTDYNQSFATDYRWRREGDITQMPRALHEYGWNSLPSDRYVEDGSFLRFKNLTFNYAVPPSLLNKFALKQATLSVSLNNILTITKYLGVDPEVSYGAMGISKDEAITPRSRDISVGLTIGF